MIYEYIVCMNVGMSLYVDDVKIMPRFRITVAVLMFTLVPT